MKRAAIAVLLPLTAAMQLALALVYLVPYHLPPDAAPLVLLDVHGEPLATLGGHWTPLAELPAIAVSSVIESEDEGFWDHRGIDAVGIVRAAWLDARGGRFGGSTLTMQVAQIGRAHV